MSTGVQPWRDLPKHMADVIEPELPAVTEEILAVIAQEVPEYARPLEGSFGEGLRAGVDEALNRFVDLVRDRDSTDDHGRQVSMALGRAELRAGRTLDALQSAYRVGARVAWRRFAAACQAADVDQMTAARLAEAIFAYLDGLSADSVEGYAHAQSELAGERQRRRAELVAALLGRTPGADAVRLAADLDWPLPRTAATMACSADRLAGLARRLGPDVLTAHLDGLGCVIVPDAEGPGRRDLLRVAAARRPAAIGPDLPVDQLSTSWQLAVAALQLAAGDAPVVADEHLATLLIERAGPVIDRIGATRLASFETLSPSARARMIATALAYVQHVGNAAAMARALHVHPQTARYRIGRLRELLGNQLDDPDARFELEAALRADAVGTAERHRRRLDR